MPDVPVSKLGAATLPLTGTEEVPVVQNGVSVRAPASAFGINQQPLTISSPDESLIIGGSSTALTAEVNAMDYGGALNVVPGAVPYANLPPAANYLNKFAATTDQGPVWSDGNNWYPLLNKTAGSIAISSPAILPPATQNSAYTYTLHATGAIGQVSWLLIPQPDSLNSFSGALSSGGVLSLTPTVAGNDTFIAQVQDSTGAKTFQVFSLPVLASTAPSAAPTFSPAAGTYPTAQTVTLSTTTPGASIYYTLNGTQPTTGSTLYAGPITVSATETITAIATTIGGAYTQSPTAAAVYVISAAITNPIGANIAAGGAAQLSYEGRKLFRNIARECRGWSQIVSNSASETLVPYTAAGWPAADFACMLFEGSITQAYMLGNYSCGFTAGTGHETVTAFGNCTLVGTPSYAAAGGVTTFTLNVTSGVFGFQVTNTGGLVTNIFAYLPAYNTQTGIDDVMWSPTNNPFTNEAVAFYEQFGHVRNMWFSNALENTQMFTTSSAPNYSSGTSYAIGAVVFSSGINWQAIAPTTGNAPGAGSVYWVPLGPPRNTPANTQCRKPASSTGGWGEGRVETMTGYSATGAIQGPGTASGATFASVTTTGAVMTVAGTITGAFCSGLLLSGSGIPSGAAVSGQTGGTTGGAGTYTVTWPTQGSAPSLTGAIAVVAAMPTGATSIQLANWVNGPGQWAFVVASSSGTLSRVGTIAAGQGTTNVGVTFSTALQAGLNGTNAKYDCEGYPIEWLVSLANACDIGLDLHMGVLGDGAQNAAGTGEADVFQMLKTNWASSGEVRVKRGNELWEGNLVTYAYEGLAYVNGYAGTETTNNLAAQAQYGAYSAHQLANVARANLPSGWWGSVVNQCVEWQTGGNGINFCATLLSTMATNYGNPAADVQWYANAPYCVPYLYSDAATVGGITAAAYSGSQVTVTLGSSASSNPYGTTYPIASISTTNGTTTVTLASSVTGSNPFSNDVGLALTFSGVSGLSGINNQNATLIAAGGSSGAYTLTLVNGPSTTGTYTANTGNICLAGATTVSLPGITGITAGGAATIASTGGSSGAWTVTLNVSGTPAGTYTSGGTMAMSIAQVQAQCLFQVQNQAFTHGSESCAAICGQYGIQMTTYESTFEFSSTNKNCGNASAAMADSGMTAAIEAYYGNGAAAGFTSTAGVSAVGLLNLGYADITHYQVGTDSAGSLQSRDLPTTVDANLLNGSAPIMAALLSFTGGYSPTRNVVASSGAIIPGANWVDNGNPNVFGSFSGNQYFTGPNYGVAGYCTYTLNVPVAGTYNLLPTFSLTTSAWSSSTSYSVGATVSYAGAQWISIQNSNLNHAPGAGSSWWTACTCAVLLGGNSLPAGGQVVRTGQVIASGQVNFGSVSLKPGISYVCLGPNPAGVSANPVPSSTYVQISQLEFV